MPAANQMRALWQGDKVDASVKSPIGSAGDKDAMSQSDILCDEAWGFHDDRTIRSAILVG